MAWLERGKVHGTSIVFSKPLELPEGTEVEVRIEPVAASRQTAAGGEDFAALPFFGMWANREDMSDSVAWVRTERERWQQRPARQD